MRARICALVRLCMCALTCLPAFPARAIADTLALSGATGAYTRKQNDGNNYGNVIFAKKLGWFSQNALDNRYFLR